MARKTPAEQRVKANKVRGLKIPDWEAGFVRMILLIDWGLDKETAAPDECA
jgi:hypothetical protein